MLHCMKLHPEPFAKIQNGSKTIELRLYDEKRQQIQVGDYISFTRTDDAAEQMQVRVTALHCFEHFAALYAHLPLLQCGYTEENLADAAPSDMEQYYSPQEQLRYGVVGIALRRTDLQRFLDAQAHGYQAASVYVMALEELRRGKKETHWMWYVFPQIAGLGCDEITAYFALRDLAEARDYVQHPILGERLRICSQALLSLETDDPVAVFGLIDAYKLRSCMTLFRAAAPEETVFQAVLDRFCMGMPDEETLALLARQSQQEGARSECDIKP